MEGSMEVEHTIGKKVQLCMREHLKMALDMERENGHNLQPSTMGLTLKVSNKDTASFIFQVEISIRATSFRIKGKDMDRYSGMTAVSTKANGKMEFKMAKARFICLVEKLLVESSKTQFWFKYYRLFMRNNRSQI